VSGDAGYTLTEILVVMAVIGLIAAVLTPGIISQLGRARAKSAQMQVETLAAGVEVFRSDVNRYPNQSEGLNALLTDTGAAGWTGPYIKNANVLKDPWGNLITYKVDAQGKTFGVTSLGADGAAGGSGLDRDLVAP
jgi:general secretion pathway protein G